MPSSPTYSSKPLDASSSPHLLTLVEGALEEELGLRDLSRQLLHGGGALSSATKLQQSLFVSDRIKTSSWPPRTLGSASWRARRFIATHQRSYDRGRSRRRPRCRRARRLRFRVSSDCRSDSCAQRRVPAEHVRPRYCRGTRAGFRRTATVRGKRGASAIKCWRPPRNPLAC